jgi:hypothetical protein
MLTNPNTKFRKNKKNPQISNYMEIRPVGSELFRGGGQAGGQTDKNDEANSRFSQFRKSALKRLFPRPNYYYVLFIAMKLKGE